jgi:hypothetical protein
VRDKIKRSMETAITSIRWEVQGLRWETPPGCKSMALGSVYAPLRVSVASPARLMRVFVRDLVQKKLVTVSSSPSLRGWKGK